MKHVDALSRAAVEEAQDDRVKGRIWTIVTREDEILVSQ